MRLRDVLEGAAVLAIIAVIVAVLAGATARCQLWQLTVLLALDIPSVRAYASS